jgi:hypothetical protein
MQGIINPLRPTLRPKGLGLGFEAEMVPPGAPGGGEGEGRAAEAAGGAAAAAPQELPPWPGMSRLDAQIAAYARCAAPTPHELAALAAARSAVADAVQHLWPGERVALFGSQACGLALPGAASDLDMVAYEPGSAAPHRDKVLKRLHELLEELRRRHLLCLEKRAAVVGAMVRTLCERFRLWLGRAWAARCEAGPPASSCALGRSHASRSLHFFARSLVTQP